MKNIWYIYLKLPWISDRKWECGPHPNARVRQTSHRFLTKPLRPSQTNHHRHHHLPIVVVELYSFRYIICHPRKVAQSAPPNPQIILMSWNVSAADILLYGFFPSLLCYLLLFFMLYEHYYCPYSTYRENFFYRIVLYFSVNFSVK